MRLQSELELGSSLGKGGDPHPLRSSANLALIDSIGSMLLWIVTH